MKLWTVTEDYFATGEGRTIMAFIGYAENEKEALKLFGKHFDPYFKSSAKVEEGIVENAITGFLFSKESLEYAKKVEGKANIEMHAKMHFNFS